MRKYFALIFIALCSTLASASVTVTVNGTNYTIPQTGEKGWGTNVTSWIQAASSHALWPTGGAFTLGADVDFGSSFGLLSPYYKSKAAIISSNGALRLGNAEGVGWRNLGNTSDFLLKPDADGILQYNSIDLVNLSATQTLTNKTLTSPALASPSITGVASLAAGTVAAPALTFTGDTDNGLYYIGVNHWGAAAGGAEALDFNVSAGSFGNVGIGGAASTADAYPLLINRTTVGGTSQFQLTNGDTTAGAGAKMQIFADGGNNQMEVSSFTAATVAPDAYAGGRGVVRAAGALTGLSLVADTSISSDVKIYAGGNAAGNKIATFNSSGETLNTGAFTGSGSGLTSLNASNISSGTLAIAQGGTGQATANAALNALLPTQTTNSGKVLSTNGTSTSWASVLSNPMTTTGDLIYSSDNSGTAARLATGSTGQYLKATSSSAPSWVSFTSHTTTIKTSTGTTSGYEFGISGVTIAPTNGAVYTNNGNSYTVIGTSADKQTVWTSGAGAPLSSGTLTKTSGTGDATITFSFNYALATYTAPSTAKALWVRVVGSGGGGGGCGNAGAGTVGAGGGGGGGGYTEKLITSPNSIWYYQVGVAGSGASAGNNSGSSGNRSSIVSADGSVLLLATGGVGGASSAGGQATPVFTSTAASPGNGSGGDLNISGTSGAAGFGLTSAQTLGGMGGSTPLGMGAFGAQGTGTGSSASGYGAGGGGGAATSSNGGQAGGAGAAGIIDIVELYNGN